VVTNPLFDRVNTKDNTPAIVHIRIVPGEQVRMKIATKGFGAENKSIVRMLVPADGVEGVKQAVVIQSEVPDLQHPVGWINILRA